ncbi:MAG TPA: hypothetical protein VLA00_13085 [Xanthobacteraceae bacterium]|nr:hypothetical protein [Xanthobacteraceae bacterium]
MLAELEALRDRLKTAQTELLMHAAKSNLMPSDGMLRKIADLEMSLVAVETLLDEQKAR